MSAVPVWVPVCRSEELFPGMRRVIEIGDKQVLVLVEDDGIFAIENACPHHGAALDRGRVAHGYIECPWHRWLIDVRSGQCFHVSSKVESFRTETRDGVLYVGN